MDDGRPTQVALVGLMGAGKSTVGRLVAARTGRLFVDVDDAIVDRTGKTVRELWETGGEAAYRKLETAEVVAALSAPTPTVLAAPGGVVMDPVARDALEKAFVVWLRADPSTLAGRVRPGDHRPLLGDHPYEVFENMDSERSSLYESVADAVVDTASLVPSDAAQAVLRFIREAGI